MQRLARESGKWGGNKFQSGSLLDTNQPFPCNRFSSKKTSHHRRSVNQKHLETINLVSTSASAAPIWRPAQSHARINMSCLLTQSEDEEEDKKIPII